MFFFSLQRPSPERPFISGGVHLHLCASKMHLKQLPDAHCSSPRYIQFRHCQPFHFCWMCRAAGDSPKAICVPETQIAGIGSQDSVHFRPPQWWDLASKRTTESLSRRMGVPNGTPGYFTATRNEAHSRLSLRESVWKTHHSFEIVATQAGLPLAWQSFCCLAVQ